MNKINLLVVDDHVIVREGICALLELSAEIKVLGEAANGLEALEMVQKNKPEVVLMDLLMPVMNGFEATSRITREYPGIKVLALTQHDDREHAFQIIEAGASGFINKRVAYSEMVAGIKAVYKGESFLSPTVAKYLIEDFRGSKDRTEKDLYSSLTDREREILKLLAEGYTTQEIGDLLVISSKTVEGHKTRLMSKLELNNRVELVKYAIRKGITPL